MATGKKNRDFKFSEDEKLEKLLHKLIKLIIL